MYIVHNYEPEDKPIPPTDDEIKKKPPKETPKAHNSGVRYSISTRNDNDTKHEHIFEEWKIWKTCEEGLIYSICSYYNLINTSFRTKKNY